MKKMKKPLIALMFALLIFVLTITTKVMTPSGYVSLGDTLVLLAACFLPTGYAMLAALLGSGLAAFTIGGVSLILPIAVVRVLAACWFIDDGNKILEGRNITGVIASAVIFLLGGYVSDMIQTGDLLAPLGDLPINAVALAANVVLFFVLALACDLLHLRPLLLGKKGEKKDHSKQS